MWKECVIRGRLLQRVLLIAVVIAGCMGVYTETCLTLIVVCLYGSCLAAAVAVTHGITVADVVGVSSAGASPL